MLDLTDDTLLSHAAAVSARILDCQRPYGSHEIMKEIIEKL
jgi:hypothetical protein